MFEIFLIGGLALVAYLLVQSGDSMLTGFLGKLTSQQIAALASEVGFSGQDLITATAIAIVESNGGNPNAYNPETQVGTPEGKGSYGLWQIYLYKHPEFEGWNLYDPLTNARAAYKVYQEQGFSAWSTFNSGKYQNEIAYAEEGVQGVIS